MNFGVLFFILISLFMIGSVYNRRVFAAPKNKSAVIEDKQKDSSQK